MAKKFNCPACGVPMEYDGETTLFQTCKSCGAPIVVPSSIVETSRDEKIESIVNMPTSDATYEAQSAFTADENTPTPLDDPKVIANARIFEEINAGNKIMAIKLHREAFGTDLLTAKDAIETLERDIARSKNSQTETPQRSIPAYEENQMLGIIYDELNAGNKINAIKVFRETFNTSLKNAKEAVDAMEERRKDQCFRLFIKIFARYGIAIFLFATIWNKSKSSQIISKLNKNSALNRFIINKNNVGIIFA